MALGSRGRVLGDWLDAADPGAIRRHHATRAALAALTAWLVVRSVVGWLAGRPLPAVGLYAVAMCFIGALVIVDARRAERQVTQLLSIAMVAVGLLLASLLNGSEWYYRAVLLALMFASYAVRQRGLRPGELVLVLTMSLYFAEGSGVAWGNLAWFSVCGRGRAAQPLAVAVRAAALRSEAVVTQQRSGVLPPRGCARRRRGLPIATAPAPTRRGIG